MKKTILLLLASTYLLTSYTQKVTVKDTLYFEKLPNQNKQLVLNTVHFKPMKRKVKQDDIKLLKDLYRVRKGNIFILINKQPTFRQYHRYYNGIFVKDNTYTFEGDDSTTKYINGVYKDINLSTTPKFSDSAAFKSAFLHLNKNELVWNDTMYKDLVNFNCFNEKWKPIPPRKPILIFYQPYNKDDYKLVYFLYMYSSNGLSQCYIDANTLEVYYTDNGDRFLNSLKNTDTIGYAATLYSGTRNINTTKNTNNKFILSETRNGTTIETRKFLNSNTDLNGQGIADGDFPSFISFDTIIPIKYILIEDNDNNWTRAEWFNQDTDIVALDIHWAIEKTPLFNRN